MRTTYLKIMNRVLKNKNGLTSRQPTKKPTHQGKEIKRECTGKSTWQAAASGHPPRGLKEKDVKNRERRETWISRKKYERPFDIQK